MNKITAYKALIVDLDGTLYYQSLLRAAMIKEMLLHFWRLPDFLIIKKYREMYEHGYSEEERLHQLPERTSKVIEEWMIQRPLKYVAAFRDKRLIKLLQDAQRNGVKIIIYSDYPVKDKLQALNFQSDYAFSSADTGCLKPDASGLLNILYSYAIGAKDCLVIGDRYDKDGKLAENMGTDYILLPAREGKRIPAYECLSTL